MQFGLKDNYQHVKKKNVCICVDTQICEYLHAHK